MDGVLVPISVLRGKLAPGAAKYKENDAPALSGVLRSLALSVAVASAKAEIRTDTIDVDVSLTGLPNFADIRIEVPLGCT